MFEIIDQLREKARKELKTVILPEGNDPKVLAAAARIKEEGLANVILLKEDMLEAAKIDKFAGEFYDLRKHKGITIEDAREALKSPLYYAAMMVRKGEADGFVAGATHSTPDVIRASIYCLGVNPRFATVSSCFIMAIPGWESGEKGGYIFADCGVISQPTARELANIAICTADFASTVLDFIPRVAMLSYSTKGSARGESVERIREAVNIVRASFPDLIIDGEVQVDSAIVPEVARIKGADDVLKGQANILIFPNLDAGNISYKLVNRLARARAIGPILQGLNKPASDLSRGCIVEEIVDCAVVTAVRAQKSKVK
jgi:phosphate acetyltransferase